MIGESIYTYITKEPMMSSIQMKNAAADAAAPVALAAPAALVSPVPAVSPVALVSPVPAAAPVLVPVFYPNMFDRWAIPF
jgi:hypothetical protein